MATVVINQPNHIEFKNLAPKAPADEVPTFVAQAGTWQVGNNEETGIVLDVSGKEPPLLLPPDARKLAKWLLRAADDLEGVKTEKKKKSRRHWEENEDENDY